jgi:hypothetical protein
MPTFKENVELTRDSFMRNLDICWRQAKGIQHVSALGAMTNRHDKAIVEFHTQQFDEAHKVVQWVEQIKQFVLKCPNLSEGEKKVEPPVTPPPVQIEN